ncbi:MAG: hypothetical protein IJQ02_11690 [Oscillospiraceae bacterium]|nr:hypothetical protein [Oscillospiraceae bacterium]
MNTQKEKNKALSTDINDTVTDIVQKKHRNRPDLANYGEEHAEPGDNARFLRLARVSQTLPPIDISDPKQVEDRINLYFDFCEQNDRKPNIKGLGNWLGVDATTVNSWRRGEYRGGTHSPVIKRAVDILEEMWWDYGQNGKCNPASWIFIGKNAFQMKDVQDVIVTPQAPLGETIDAEEIEKKYRELPEE